MTLLREVIAAMGKSEVDEDAVNMASNVLKYMKSIEMMAAVSALTRHAAMRIRVASETNGAKAIYERVLLNRIPTRRKRWKTFL